ncbi:MAG: NAD-dependent epimerase/dehydratase family protein [Leptospirales bacterium]
MVKNWLITGGCGFIGTALITRILKENPEAGIRVLDNLSVGSRNDLSAVGEFKEIIVADTNGSPQGIELLVGDIRDIFECKTAATGVDVIVHLAANTGVGPSVENPVFDMECNVNGTLNMLEAAREKSIAQFVFASSGAPVGEVEPPIHEEIAPHPVSPYGASKLAGEGYCSAYFQTFEVRTVALRFGNVYGPGSKHKSSVVAKFIRQALEGETCEVYGDGKQTRDFIYIDDLLEAVILAAEFEDGGEVFQIATSRESTVNEVVEMIKQELKEIGNIDMKLVYGERRLGDVLRNFSDTTKAKNVLGWDPEHTLKDGIQKTVRYFLPE